MSEHKETQQTAQPTAQETAQRADEGVLERGLEGEARDWREAWRQDKLTITSLALIGALILFSYAVARGPTESLFLADYSADALPGLWVEIGLAAALVVSLYNRALRYVSLSQLFQLSYAFIALSLAALLWWPGGGDPSASAQQGPLFTLGGLAFPYGRSTLLRLWCDLYIVVLIETYWSLANLYFPLKVARYLYGGLCAAGTLGSMAGNLFVRSYAQDWSTEGVILLVFPSLALMSLLTVPLGLAYQKHREALHAHTHTQDDLAGEETKRGSLLGGLRVIIKSDYLLWILWLVLISQVVITLIDYQYQDLLKATYSDTDARTAFQGLLYLSIDLGSLLMQVLTGVIVSTLSVGGTLVAIPVTLALLCLSPAVMSALIAIATAKSAGKVLTYSIFKSAKELLYFPLSYEEQTQGKAVIDILAYRQAKILTSALLLILGALGWGLDEVRWLTFASLALWLWGALMLWRATRKRGLS